MWTNRLGTGKVMAGALVAAFAALSGLPAAAQDPTPITFVQPSPSAINSFPVFVAIGEGYFAEEGLEVTVESINGSGAVSRPRSGRNGRKA